MNTWSTAGIPGTSRLSVISFSSRAKPVTASVSSVRFQVSGATRSTFRSTLKIRSAAIANRSSGPPRFGPACMTLPRSAPAYPSLTGLPTTLCCEHCSPKQPHEIVDTRSGHTRVNRCPARPKYAAVSGAVNGAPSRSGSRRTCRSNPTAEPSPLDSDEANGTRPATYKQAMPAGLPAPHGAGAGNSA